MRIAYAIALGAVAACGRIGSYDVPVRNGNSDTDTDAGDSDNPVVQWQELDGSASGGGVSNHSGDASCAHIGVDNSGRVYAVWTDDGSGNAQVYVRAFASAWASLDGSGDGAGLSQGVTAASDGTHFLCSSSLAFDASDQAYVAWQNYSGSEQPIYMRIWSGSGWSELGGSATSGGITGDGLFAWWPDVVIDGDGRAVVAYELASNPFVLRWDGAWSGVSGAGNGNGLSQGSNISFLPSLATGDGDELYAVWGEYGSGATMSLRAAHWTASGWTALGDVVGTTRTAQEPATMVLAAGTPTIMWADADDASSQVQIVQWNGSSWQALPTPAPEGGAETAIAVDRNGAIVIAWGQNGALHGARWDGSAWQSLDDPDTENLTGASTPTHAPELAVDGDNRIVLLWLQADGSGVQQVYVKRSLP